MSKLVYDYRKCGLRFLLYPDGVVTVSSKDLPERQLCRYSTLTPRIPTQKEFNGLCRKMILEGDVDDVLSAQARISRERGMKRNAGVELYAALESLLRLTESAMHRANADGSNWDIDEELSGARAALAKARGE